MSPRKKTQEEVSIADLFSDIAKKFQQQATKPNILGYQPHHKQLLFHKMDDFLRLYMGGNRSGKTYSAVVEDIWWASGTHPYVNIKANWPHEQIRGRVVAVDFDRGVHGIIIPLFKALCPPSYLRGGTWETAWETRGNGGVLNFVYEKSFIEFMSYEQSTEKFAGTSRHFIHYDEEPPEHIYRECEARLIDTRGRSWISMTPVEGMTWVYDKIYGPAEESDDKEILVPGGAEIEPVWRSRALVVGVIGVGMNENPHLDPEARERYLSSLDPDERAARSKGRFVQTAGKVFKNFSVEEHVTDQEINPKDLQRRGWQIYTSVDHGFNAPTAWLWHAVAPEGFDEVITFHEHYKSEMTVEEHATVVKGLEAEWGLNAEDIIRTGDPVMHQRSGITGGDIVQEYAKHGIYIYTESIPTDRGIGIARMQQYFRIREIEDSNTNQVVRRPIWRIYSQCVNFIRELKNLRWKAHSSKKVRDQNNVQEQVHKLNDHAFDSAKYFATFLPELAPEPLPAFRPDGRGATMSYDEALAQSLARSVDQGPNWIVVETYN